MFPLWLLTLFAASFAIGMDVLIIAGLLPGIATDFGIAEAGAGQLVTVFSLSYALSAPVIAVLTGRLPRRPVLLTALAVFVAANLLAAVAPTFGSLLGLRIAAALAAATATPLGFALVAERAPAERRGRYLGLLTSALTVALVLGVPIGTWVGANDWRHAFGLVALVGAVALIGIALTVRPGPVDSPSLRLGGRIRPLRRPAIAATLAAVVVGGAGGMMSYVYLAPLARETAGIQTPGLAVLIAVFGAFGIVGTLVGGAVADRLPPARAILLTFGGTAVAAGLLWLLGRLGPVPPVVLGIAVAGYAFWVWSVNPPIQVRLLALAGPDPTAVIALNVSAIYAGFTLAGGLGGAALAGFGVPGLSTAAAALLTSSVVVLALIFRKERSRADR